MLDAESFEQVKGLCAYPLVSEKHRDAFKEMVKDVFEGKRRTLEYSAVGLKGRLVWLYSHAVPLRDKSGEITAMLSATADITERKASEAALGERTRQLSESQRVAHIGSWQHNLTTNEVVWSDELFRVLGLDPEKDTGDFNMFLDMIYPDDRPKLKSAIEETLETGKHFSVDYRFRLRDGRTRILQAQADLITDESGTQRILCGTGQDITERKQAEEELRTSEERYKILFNSGNDAILVNGFTEDGHSGNFIAVNDVACRMHGYTREELLKLSPLDLRHPEKDDEVARITEKLHADGRLTFETVGITKYGKSIPVEISSQVFQLKGRPVALAIVRDISRRKADERAIKEGKEFLENILDSIQDGICILDMDCNIVMVNHSMEKWYSHVAPIAGQKCYKIFMGSPDMCDRCPCEDAMVEGKSCTEVVKYNGPGGLTGTLELHAFPLLDPDTGEQKGIIEYYRDITDKVTLQAEAFRAAQLASVGELAAGVAHEINNPVNGVINYAQVLLNRFPEGSEDRDIAGRIIKEGDRISGIVAALLSFTRGLGPAEETVRVKDMLDEVFSLTGAQLGKDGVAVNMDVPPKMPALRARRQQIEQVFLNIINNARYALNRKYADAHGNKVLDIRVESMAEEEIPCVRVSFTDNGIGIARDVIEKVTEPFFTTKEKGIGTGLGLSISRSIVENHGGRLSIESAEGEYTRVVIELPLDEGR